VAVHALVQQDEFLAHTHSSHVQPPQPGVLDAVQPVGLPHPSISPHASTHAASHDWLQQCASTAHTALWHGQLQQPGSTVGRHPPLMQEYCPWHPGDWMADGPQS
jgi:hypothetical protein